MKKIMYLMLLFCLFFASCKNLNDTNDTNINKIKKHNVTFVVQGMIGGDLTAKIKDGKLLPKSPCMVESGKTVVFTAIPNDNYDVDRWFIDTEEKIFEKGKLSIEIKVEKDLDVKVVFKQKDSQTSKTHILTFEVDGNGGTIEAVDYDNGSLLGSSPATVNHGKHVMLSATSSEGYKIKQWTHDGVVVNGEKQGYDVVVEKDTVVKVSFVRKPSGPQISRKITFLVENGVGGKIKATLDDNADLGASPATVNNNTYVVFLAEPDVDYAVEGWTSNGRPVANNKTNKYRLKITNNVNIAVKFKKTSTQTHDNVNVKFEVDGNIGGSITAKIDELNISITSVAEVPKGSHITFTAKPEDNYEVDKWIGLTGNEYEGIKVVEVVADKDLDIKVKFKEKIKSKWTILKYSELESYLSNNAKTNEINYIWVKDVVAKDIKGIKKELLSEAGNLGKILKKQSNIKVALKFDDVISELKDMYAAFLQCDNLVEVENIPEGVVSLRECFMGCKSLKKVNGIPGSVKNLYGCFNMCTALSDAPKIPEGVEDMTSCFGMCSSLQEAPILPATVKNLKECFMNCIALTKAPLIPVNVTNLSGTFMLCTKLGEMPEIPSKVEDMSNCFMGCMMLTQTKTIPVSVKNMKATFEACVQITSINLDCEYNNDNFKDAFKDCAILSAMPNSISVPNAQLVAYKTGASNMGVVDTCFVGH
ncbi:MAG: InlB B-repeat-containing protein [Treponema sp.]